MTRAIGDCVNCGLEHRITVCLQVADPKRGYVGPKWDRKTPQAPECGTPTQYRRGCRCDGCLTAHADDARERRKART